MIYKDKVLKALKICSVQNDVGCQCCPYFDSRKTYGHEWCTTEMAQDALALLKQYEQSEQASLRTLYELTNERDKLLKELGREDEHKYRDGSFMVGINGIEKL